VPIVRDELRFVVRHDLMQDTARDTLTIATTQRKSAADAVGWVRSCRAKWWRLRRAWRATPGGGPTWNSRSAASTRSATARVSFRPI